MRERVLVDIRLGEILGQEATAGHDVFASPPEYMDRLFWSQNFDRAILLDDSCLASLKRRLAIDGVSKFRVTTVWVVCYSDPLALLLHQTGLSHDIRPFPQEKPCSHDS